MSYAEHREYMRKYQREWLARRRAEWFANRVCVWCSSIDRLELDHKDPTTKVSSCVWSWTQERRDAEIAKCQVLCHDCHVLKTFLNKERPRGERVAASKLTEQKVRQIRIEVGAGATKRGTARKYEVDEKLIRLVCKREIWQHVQ